MIRVVYIVLAILLLSTMGCSSIVSSQKHTERYYQTKFCKDLNGVMEYRLPDRTRVDCLTDEYAIEVDFAKKWAEGVGQSLYYAKMTGKKPAIGLIVNMSTEKRYLKRVRSIAKEYNIKIFIILTK